MTSVQTKATEAVKKLGNIAKTNKKIVMIIALVAVGIATTWTGVKYDKYQKSYLKYSSELGKYKAQKLFYDILAQECRAAEQKQNSGMDAMNKIVYEAMTGGPTQALQKQQAEIAFETSKAQSFIRDNCIGYEYNEPTSPTKPKFW